MIALPLYLPLTLLLSMFCIFLLTQSLPQVQLCQPAPAPAGRLLSTRSQD